MTKNIRMVGPDGTVALIPEGRVEDAIKMGARVEPKKEAHPISALAGGLFSGALGSIPDIASSIYNIPASAMNYAREHAIKHPESYVGNELYQVSPNQAELPMIPSATESIGRGIENVIGETPEEYKHLLEGSKLAGAIASPGGAAKAALNIGAKGVSKGLGMLGSLKPSTLGGGALAGTTMSNLQEQGYSPLTQVGAGIAAGSLPSIAGSLSRGAVQAAKKGSMKTLGLSPKQFNIEAAKAAKESGVELPASAFTENKAMSIVDQYLGKTPYFGDKLRDKYLKGEKQTLDRLNSIYDEVGPIKTHEIEEQLSKLYKKNKENLPEHASIVPSHTIKTVDEILSTLGNSLAPSENQIAVINKLKTIKEGLTKTSDFNKSEIKWLKQNGFDDLSKIQNIKNETPISKLWDTKKSLNDTINWDIEDYGYKELLKKVQHSMLEDIAEYGKKDPTWYNSFKSTDELFGKVAKRKRLEHLLTERTVNPATGSMSHNSLSKMIHAPDTGREIKSLTSPGTYEKIEKLGEVAKTMAIKAKNIPNPSGTTILAGITAFLSSCYFAPVAATAGVIGASGLTKLLTDQKFLDLAIKTAQGTKNTKDLLKMRRKVKQLTGLSINTINRKMNREENKEGINSTENIEMSPKYTRMVGPDGTAALIPENRIQDAIKMGAKISDM